MGIFAAALLALALLPAAASPRPAPAWQRWQHLAGVFDVGGPRPDGSLVLAGSGGLFLVPPAGGPEPLARLPVPAGGEAYIAVSPGLAAAGCSFAAGDVFVLGLKPAGAVLRVAAAGPARPFAEVAGVDSLNGIAFDTAGSFGHRLLVSGPHQGHTVVAAIDCRGRVTTVTPAGPVLEGGLAVAPAGFGRFAGDLVAPDELSGRLLAIRPDGRSDVIAASGLAHGQDVGVEGVGFVPAGFSEGGAAYFADRATANNPHPGTDSLLRLGASELLAAGVEEGDLLAATEGAASLVDVRCAASCRVTTLSARPGPAHGEGHLLAVAEHPRPPAALPEASGLGAAASGAGSNRPYLAAVGALIALALALAAALGLRRRRR